MVNEGLTLPTELLRVNSLFVGGEWSEPIPEVEGWTVVEPEEEGVTMSCGVNLDTQTFEPVPVRDILPAMYIDQAVPPEGGSSSSASSSSTTPQESGPTCPGDGILIDQESCYE